jgi:hypothetical protein
MSAWRRATLVFFALVTGGAVVGAVAGVAMLFSDPAAWWLLLDLPLVVIAAGIGAFLWLLSSLLIYVWLDGRYVDAEHGHE